VALAKARSPADPSALVRVHLDPVAQRVGPLFLAGEVAAGGIVDLELLFSARSSTDHFALLSDCRSLPRVEGGDADQHHS